MYHVGVSSNHKIWSILSKKYLTHLKKLKAEVYSRQKELASKQIQERTTKEGKDEPPKKEEEKEEEEGDSLVKRDDDDGDDYYIAFDPDNLSSSSQRPPPPTKSKSLNKGSPTEIKTAEGANKDGDGGDDFPIEELSFDDDKVVTKSFQRSNPKRPFKKRPLRIRRPSIIYRMKNLSTDTWLSAIYDTGQNISKLFFAKNYRNQSF